MRSDSVRSHLTSSGKVLLSGRMIDWHCKHTFVFINYVKSLQINRAIKLSHSHVYQVDGEKVNLMLYLNSSDDKQIT